MKRKRIEQSLSLGASIGMLLLLVWGCGQESADTLSATGDPSVPVNISTSIDANILRTRGSVYNGKIGVFLRATNGYKPQYNVQYSYSNGWKAIQPVYVGAANASLCAYYPYKENLFTEENPTICTLTAKENTIVNELFYAKDADRAVSIKSLNASFTMVRAYASLKLSILRHASYGGNCNISKVNFKIGNTFDKTCTFDISTGLPIEGGGSATKGGWNCSLSTSIASGSTDTKYNVLVPPQKITDAGLTITLTIDGSARFVTIPADKFTKPELASGKQYTIRLLITDTEVIPNGWPDLEVWLDDNTVIENEPIVINP